MATVATVEGNGIGKRVAINGALVAPGIEVLLADNVSIGINQLAYAAETVAHDVVECLRCPLLAEDGCGRVVVSVQVEPLCSSGTVGLIASAQVELARDSFRLRLPIQRHVPAMVFHAYAVVVLVIQKYTA